MDHGAPAPPSVVGLDGAWVVARAAVLAAAHGRRYVVWQRADGTGRWVAHPAPAGARRGFPPMLVRFPIRPFTVPREMMP